MGSHREHPGPDEQINLKVQGQDGSVVKFLIKKHTVLEKLMKAYSDRAQLNIKTVRWTYDGQSIGKSDTPQQLAMEEGDTIEVYQQLTEGPLR